ncbi:MAG: glycosyltransferase family 4 protein [Idiomarina sp.]|nr:glycosyltransferase family 4 protein [Idiomarina sp.]
MLLQVLTTVVLSFVLTFLMRRYALRQDILDTPNDRSSHTIPTPRGGGVSIVLVSLLVLFLWGTQEIMFLWFAAATIVIGLIGFLDDRGDIQPLIRLAAHFAAAALVVIGAGGLAPLVFFGYDVDLGLFGDLLAVIGVVWLLNLYNFMDGINGIASIEALTSKLTIALLMLLSVGVLTSVIQVHILLAAAVFGFFLWNFPKARIFMGDAGSGFLGIIVAAMMLASAQVHSAYFWAWLIVLGVFIVDATFTLIRRLVRGDKVFEAHRSHAYQWASRIHGSHVSVTMTVFAINVIWLAPFAGFVVFGIMDGFLALIIAYIPLVLLAIKYKAGALETMPSVTDIE